MRFEFRAMEVRGFAEHNWIFPSFASPTPKDHPTVDDLVGACGRLTCKGAKVTAIITRQARLGAKEGWVKARRTTSKLPIGTSILFGISAQRPNDEICTPTPPPGIQTPTSSGRCSASRRPSQRSRIEIRGNGSQEAQQCREWYADEEGRILHCANEKEPRPRESDALAGRRGGGPLLLLVEIVILSKLL